MKLKVGQTFRLLSGEVVTIVSLPDKKGWLRAFSHNDGSERTYGAFAFDQRGVELLEVRLANANAFAPSSPLLAPLRNLIEEVVRGVLAEESKQKRRRAKRRSGSLLTRKR